MARFSVLSKFMNFSVTQLSGHLQTDIKLMDGHDVILGTPEQMDQVSRRWRNRESVQQTGLLIMDNTHLLDHCTLEVVASRFRYMSSQMQEPVRILAFAYSVANYKDIAEWLGVHANHAFNFSPLINPRQMDTHF